MTAHSSLLVRRSLRFVGFGAVVNGILAIIKIASGIAGNSTALVADGIESCADVLTSMIVGMGLYVSVRPADDNHPYGHGKAEPIAGLAVSVALVCASVLVVAHVLRHNEYGEIPSGWTLPLLLAVILCKEFLFRAMNRYAVGVDSVALAAESVHHRSDAITSAAAFIGIGIALLGQRYTGNPAWAASDDIAALIASGVIAFNGYRVGVRALYELSDVRPQGGLEEDVRRVALSTPGVVNLHTCTVRKMGFDYYVELDVRVDRNMPVFEAHEIAHRVQDSVRAEVAGGRIARVLVHIEPART